MRRIAVALLLLAAIASLASAARYMSASEFMPYHAIVAGREWSTIEPGTQTIILGMLRILAAGFMATGIAIAALCYPVWRNERWASWAVLAVGSATYVPTLSVTLMLKSAAPAANPPTLPVAIIVVLLLAGCVLSLVGKRAPDTNVA